jgi:hypothetical protein
MPLYAAGQKIRGSEINALPQAYRVSAPQICNNSATLRDVAGLAFQGEINAWYLVECFLGAHVHPTGRIKLQWDVPAGAEAGPGGAYTGSMWTVQGILSTENAAQGKLDSTLIANVEQPHVRSGDIDEALMLVPIAMIVMAGTPGTCKLQFAQSVVTVHDTVIRAGSCMRVSRLA